MKRKHDVAPVTMRDVAEWRDGVTENHGLYARIIWSRGSRPGEWRVTAQAVQKTETGVRVHAEVYDVWPKRSVASVEALMFGLMVTLERSITPPGPLMAAPPTDG